MLAAAGAASAQPELRRANDDVTEGRRNAIVRAAETVGPAVVTVSVLRRQLVEGPAFPEHREFFAKAGSLG